MSIRATILGFLSWKPFTGYELKKLFADSLSFYWTGNNNQIYGSLIQLHAEGAVELEVQQQEKLPARKLYSITEKGREELRAWLLSEPELPQLRNLFHIRLAWSDCLGGPELEALLLKYEALLEAQILMCRESARRRAEGLAAGGARSGAAVDFEGGSLAGAGGGGEGQSSVPGRSPRETFIWKKIEEGLLDSYEGELAWARSLREGLKAFENEPPRGEGGRS